MLEALSSCYLTNTVYKNSLIQVQRNPRSKAHYKSKSHLEFFCYQVGQTCLARTGHQLLELFWKFPADVKMIFWLKKRLSEILRHPSKRWRCQGGGGESERGKTEVHLRFHSHSHILKYIHFTEIHAFTFTHSLQLFIHIGGDINMGYCNMNLGMSSLINFQSYKYTSFYIKCVVIVIWEIYDMLRWIDCCNL